MKTPSVFHYDDMTKAWHGLHDYMFNQEKTLRERGGIIYGSELVSYDNFILIKDATLDPKFNFGRTLGYKTKKWAKLINNYFNPNYLDLIKHEVIQRELKGANSYNFSYRFDNSHGSGKDCLLSLSFCRRKGEKEPIVIFTSRASEVTKRLAFDFLLIQRMAEYVYGPGKTIQLECFLPFIFLNLECSLMYVSEFGKKVIRKPEDGYSPFQLRLLKKLKLYQTIDTDTIKYKVHQRAARQVQRDDKGNPIANCPDLFAENLDLTTSARYAKNDLDDIKTPKAARASRKEAPNSEEAFLKFRTVIRANKKNQAILQQATLAIASNNLFFWPKGDGWAPELLQFITRPANQKYKNRIIKILAKYS